MGKPWQTFMFWGSKVTEDGDCSVKLRPLLLGRKVMTNLDSMLKSREIILPTKVHLVKAMVFLVVMYGCESWTIKKAECWRIDAFELWCWRGPLKSPLDCKEIQPVHAKGDQSWLIFIERTDAEAETPIFWPPDLKNWFIGKDLDAGKDWRWEEKGTTEDEMVGWHRWLNGNEWVNSRSWWWTGRPGVLWSMGSQIRHNWATELNGLRGDYMIIIITAYDYSWCFLINLSYILTLPRGSEGSINQGYSTLGFFRSSPKMVLFFAGGPHTAVWGEEGVGGYLQVWRS